MQKKLEDLTIKDAFMFAAVMADEEQCRKFLEVALEMDILEVQVVTERSFSYHPEYHGVRLDVLAEEKGTKRRFNVEMQVKKEVALDKRSRYYHAQMTMDTLLAGQNYEQLPDTYVIFICDFDPYKKGLYKYIARMRIDNIGDALSDGQITVVLSSKGKNADQVPRELVNFLQYVNDPEKTAAIESLLVDDIKERIEKIKKSRRWEERYMLLEEMMRDERLEAQQEERKRMNQLIQMLLKQNRIDDVKKVTENSEYCELLLKEFNL